MASTAAVAPNTHDNNDDGARDRAQDAMATACVSPPPLLISPPPPPPLVLPPPCAAMMQHGPNNGYPSFGL